MAGEENNSNNDELIRVQMDMLEEMRAQRAALGTLAATNREIAKAQGINLKNSKDFDDSISGMSKSARSTNPLYEAQAKSLDIATKVQDNYTAAQTSSTQAVKSFTKAMLDTEKSFGKYGGVLDSAGDAALSLGKNFGIVGLALGGIVKGATMVAKASFEQTDRILKASDELGKMGTAGSFTSKELLAMGHSMGLTSKNLDLLTKPIKDLGPNLLSLSGNVGDGVKNFSQLTSVTNEQREAFQRMGVSQEDLIKTQGDYLALQAINGRNLKSEMKDREALKRASLEYTQNLLVLADISGQDVESIKAKQKDAAKELDWQIAQTKLENQIDRAKQEGREEDLKRLQLEKKTRTELLNATVALGDKTTQRGIQQFLSTGTTSGEDAQKLAVLGLTDDLVKLRDAVTNGADATNESAKFEEKYNQAVRRMVDVAGTSAANNKDVASAVGITVEGLQKGNRQRGDGLQKELEASRARIDAAGKPGKDPAQDARAALTTAEITAQKALDKLLDSVNPLTNGFTSLTVAAGVAATALLAMAGAQGFGKLKDMISGLPGAGKSSLPGQLAGGISSAGGTPLPTTGGKPITGGMSSVEREKYSALRSKGIPASEAKKQASGFKGLPGAKPPKRGAVSSLAGAGGDHLQALGEMGSGGTLKGLAEGLNAFANPKILLGATIFGSSVGIIITTVGAGLAAATWLMGKALPTLVDGIKSFQDLDGDKLKKAGGGIFELGKGLAIFGVGGAAAGIGNLMDGIGSLFGGKTPIDKLVDFSKLDIDSGKVKNNAEALAAFGQAMSSASGLGTAGLGNLVANVADGIGNLVGGTSLIDKLADFSIVEVDARAVRNNADAFIAYGEAMSKFPGGAAATSGMGNLVANISDGISKLFGGSTAIEKFVDFSKMKLGDNVKTNSEAFKSYAEAMSAFSGAGAASSAMGNAVASGLDKLFGTSILDKFKSFSKLDIDPKKTKESAEAFKIWAEGVGALGGAGGGGTSKGGTAPAASTTAPATTPAASTTAPATGTTAAATGGSSAAPKTTNYTINGRTVTKDQYDKFIAQNPELAGMARAVQLSAAPAGSPGNMPLGGTGGGGVKPVNAAPSLGGGPGAQSKPPSLSIPGGGSAGGDASIPSGGGGSTAPSMGSLNIPKQSQSKVGGNLSGNAAKLAEELEKQGITNPIAKKAIIQTAAKESGLNPEAKESGAVPYLKTLASRGIDYIWKVFPQLKPGGRVAKEKGFDKTGVPAEALQAEWSKGDENFFDYVYGGLSTNKGPGDAYKYRGRGFIGITGRTVYDKVGKEVGKDFVKDPDQVSNDFEGASAALAGYLFMSRGGKDKALKDLNGMKDPTEALKYTLNTVAGLGHKASDFDVAGSHLHEQLRKASQYDDLGSKAVSARDGGLVDGPSSGYPATLHGREIISPLKPDSILEMLAQTPAKSTEPTQSISQGETAMIDLRDMQIEFYEKMMEKFDDMIDKLSDSNDIQNDLLRYTKA